MSIDVEPYPGSIQFLKHRGVSLFINSYRVLSHPSQPVLVRVHKWWVTQLIGSDALFIFANKNENIKWKKEIFFS